MVDMADELRAVYSNIWVNEASVPPRIIFTVSFEPLRETMHLFLTGGRLSILSASSSSVQIGQVYSKESFIPLYGGKEAYRTELNFEVDPWKLEKIEQIRAGSDLVFQLIVDLHRKRENESTYHTVEILFVRHPEHGDRIKVAKSDWVENYLPKLGYRRSKILEVPILETVPEEFMQVPSYLDAAWKHYSMCDGDEVVINCRRALDSINGAIRKLGFLREVEERGEKKQVPNWRAFFGEHETLADNIEKVFRGTYGFLEPGSHAGRAISNQEAEFALMSTYSLANFVIKSFNKTRGK